MKFSIKSFFVIAAIVFLTIGSNAQCNAFAKSKALPKLKPYINTEQIYTPTLLNDDKATLPMTFYYGCEYRIVICAQEALGKIQFNLKDINGKVVFTTAAYGTIMWDFNVENTQDLLIEVVTPPGDKAQDIDKSGCAAIVVGFK